MNTLECNIKFSLKTSSLTGQPASMISQKKGSLAGVKKLTVGLRTLIFTKYCSVSV